MQFNKVTQRRKRHLAAHGVTLLNHQYTLYDNVPDLKCDTRRGCVIIAGERQSGKTMALMQMAVDLVQNTPRPSSGKRNLISIQTHADAVDSVWCLLYSLMLLGVPGKEITGPRTSEKLLKQWLSRFKMDIVIGSECMLDLDSDKYDVVHFLNDLDGFHNQLHIRLCKLFPGIKATTVAKYTREAATSYECSMHFLFSSQVAIETSITRSDTIGDQVVGTLTRAQAMPSGHQFTICFLPKATNSVVG